MHKDNLGTLQSKYKLKTVDLYTIEYVQSTFLRQIDNAQGEDKEKGQKHCDPDNTGTQNRHIYTTL